MTDFRIVNARRENIASLVAIQTECGLSEWSDGAYAAELSRAEAIVLVAIGVDGSVLGFINGSTVPGQWEGRPDAEIYNFGVLPARRQIGIGSALLREFLGKCEKTGVHSVWLDVRTSNKTAIEFYRKHGFMDAGRRPNFYTLPLEDAEMMVFRGRTGDV